jgi:hypothetical protein
MWTVFSEYACCRDIGFKLLTYSQIGILDLFYNFIQKMVTLVSVFLSVRLMSEMGALHMLITQKTKRISNFIGV